MQNLWNEIQPHLAQILSSAVIIGTMILTKAKTPISEKLKRRLEKQANKSLKLEQKLKSSYEREVELQKEIKNNVTSE